MRNALAIGVACIVLFAFSFAIGEVQTRTALFFLLGVAGLGLLATPIKWSIIILFGYLGFEGVVKIFTNYHPVIHVGVDILAVVLVLKLLILATVRRQGIPDQLPPLTPIFVLHFIWFFIAIINPYSLNIIASLAGAKVYITMVILYFFGYYYTKSTQDVHHYMWIWIFVTSVHIIFALYQSSVGPESVTNLHPGYSRVLMKYEGYAFRPFGLTALPGGASVHIFLVTPFVLYYFIHSSKLSVKIASLLFFPAAVGVLFVSQVRSALVKAILGCGAKVMSRFAAIRSRQRSNRLIQVGAIAGAVIGLTIVVPRMFTSLVGGYEDNVRAIERTMSAFDARRMAAARSGGWDRFWHYLPQVPFGAGLSRTGAASGKFQGLIAEQDFFREGFFTDNFWIAVLVDLGIPGFVFLNIIVFGLLYRGLRSYFRYRDPECQALAATLWAPMAAQVTGFIGAESILYNPEAAFFWFFAGVMMKLPSIDRELDSLSSEDFQHA